MNTSVDKPPINLSDAPSTPQPTDCPVQHRYVPELVSAHASMRPYALAVQQAELSLNYQELNDGAARLAQTLRSMGVGPDVVVAIYLDRSPAMIVAALGVLQAGGAYLPLDPNCPAERLAFILKDAQAPILVTRHNKLSALPHCPEHVVLLNDKGRLISPQDMEPGAIAGIHAENLAYVIYTSGSTGQPKGVEITHGGLLNLVCWHQSAFQVTSADRAAQLAALGFDAAVWEIWPYLTAGASLHLPSSQLPLHQPEVVLDWLLDERISIAFLPTPLAEQAMLLDWPRDMALRILLTGADTLHHYPPRNLRCQLVNNYGPTECTVVATSGTVSPQVNADRLPPIGRPIENVQIYILNRELQEIPDGEAGEIFIGGAGLARGYRNQPELTREKFIVNPFSPDADSRLYKTGDLARRLPDGQIAFVGRADEQIKIRGFRIEPAEIVKTLDEHPDVQASVVVAREVTPGDRQLVGYLVPAGNAAPTPAKLRNFLAARLPEYMIPAVFVALSDIPWNASGKIDRAALPLPSADCTLRDDAFVPPRNPVEERLAAIMASLLGLDRISVEDNFFFLGGHSLLGTQLIARLRDVFGIELSLRTLFDAPTVAMLSSQVEALLLAKLDAMSESEARSLLDIAASGAA